MTQIVQKLADSKDSLRSQSQRVGAVLCEKAGGAVVEGGQVDSGAVSVLGCLGAQERKGVGSVHAEADGKVPYCELAVACRGVKRDRLSLMLDEKPHVFAGVHTRQINV